MNEARKVWAVSSGNYSDYSVSFVVEDEQEAHKIESALKGIEQRSGGYFVEEFDLCPTGKAPMPQVIWHARGEAGGMEVDLYAEVVFGKDPPKRPEVEEAPAWTGSSGTHYPAHFYAECSDKNAAVKSVKDRLAAAMVRPA